MALRDLFGLGQRLVAVLLALLLTLSAVAAQDLMTEEERLERCKNNKARVAEIRTQLAGFPVWSAKDARQVGNDLLDLTFMLAQGSMSPSDYAKVAGMAVRYKFKTVECLKVSQEQCGIELVTLIERRQRENNFRMQERGLLLAAERRHEVNIVALACDTEAIASDVIGRWISMPVGDVILEGGLIITGKIPERNGGLRGTLEGRILTGYWWVESGDIDCGVRKFGSRHWGRMKILFEDNKQYFRGDVWSCNDPQPDIGAWKGMREGAQ